MIEIEALHLSIGNNQLLKNITLTIPKGSVYALMGANGSGKTLILKSIMGITAVSSGSVTIDGTRLTEQSKNEILSNIGVLIETPPLYSHLTVRGNLKSKQIMLQLPPEAVDYTIDFCGLTEHQHKKTDELSLGNKQRLGLALAFIGRPELIILDEPSNTLDPKASVEFRDLVLMINKELGTTFLIASHNIEEVIEIASHVCFIRKGEVRIADRVSNIFKARQIFVQGAIEEITPLISQLTSDKVLYESKNPGELIITTFSGPIHLKITELLDLKQLDYTVSDTPPQTLKRLFYD